MSLIKSSSLITLSLLSALAAVSGCADDDEDDTTERTATQGAQGATAQQDDGDSSAAGSRPPGADDAAASGDVAAAAQLDDGQVVQLMLTVNEAEIMQGELAMTRGDDERATAYAQRMVTDHSDATAMLTALSERRSIAPAQSPIDQKLQKEAGMILEALRAGDADSFDREYIDAQAVQHARVLLLVNAFEPNVGDEELRSELPRMRATVAAHLAEARAIFGELASE